MDKEGYIGVSVIILEIKPFELVGWDQENQRPLNIIHANSSVSHNELAVGKLFQCKANGVEGRNVDIVFMTGSVSDGWNGNSTTIEVGFSSNQKHASSNREVCVSEKYGLILIKNSSDEQPEFQPLQIYNTTIAVRPDIQLLNLSDPVCPLFTTITPLCPINIDSDLLLKLGKIENTLLTRKDAFVRDPPFLYEMVVRQENEILQYKFSAIYERGLLYKFSKRTNGYVITSSGEYKVDCVPRIDLSQCDVGHWVEVKINRNRKTATKILENEHIEEPSKVLWVEWCLKKRPTVAIELWTDYIYHTHKQFHYYKHNILGFIEVNSNYFEVGNKTTTVRVMRRDRVCYLPKGPSHWFVCGMIPINND